MEWQYEKEHIYHKNESGKILAETTLEYKENGEVDITHTFVDSSLRGQGIAGKMMTAVADHLREQGLKTVATCSYAYSWLKKNESEYKDIISGDIDDQSVACRIDGKH